MNMTRLDLFLFENNYASSREKAKRLIEERLVSVNGRKASKPSMKVSGDEDISVAEHQSYVGRGALKLVRAFEQFPISAEGRVCADIGASTGGFTQVLLQNGARKVYAVDVGHDQLAAELLQDDRVVNCEGVNVRYLEEDFFDEPVTLVCGDLSFISLTQILPAVTAAAADGAELVFLIKPQFEAGREALNKKGIVTDRRRHIDVLRSLCAYFDSIGLSLKGLTYSPICGGDGNREYLAYLKKSGEPSEIFDLRDITEQAFDNVR